jgi:hypothetical protein
MDNGAKKGGTPSAWDIIEKSPREGLWQLHFSEEGGAAHNVASEFIAKTEGSDAANYPKTDGMAGRELRGFQLAYSENQAIFGAVGQATIQRELQNGTNNVG